MMMMMSSTSMSLSSTAGAGGAAACSPMATSSSFPYYPHSFPPSHITNTNSTLNIPFFNRNLCFSVPLRSNNSPPNVPFISAAASVSVSSSATTVSSEEEESSQHQFKVGRKVRVKVPLKVYHVPRVPELDLTGKEGFLKQYVAVWKGKRISANLPFKVEFVVDVEGRGPVKFFAHLKEDEFEYLD